MQGKGVIHSTSDAAALQVLEQLVAPGNREGVLVKNVLVGGIRRGRGDVGHGPEPLGVRGGLFPPGRRSTRPGTASWPAAPRPAPCPADCWSRLRRDGTAGRRHAAGRRNRPASSSSWVRIMPPSPHPPRFLLGKNERVPTQPVSPAMRHSPSIFPRSDRLGGIFDHGNPAGTRDGEHFLHGRHLPVEVHHDRPGARRDGGFDRLGRDVEGARLDIDEYRRTAGIVDRAGRGEKGEGRGDDFISRRDRGAMSGSSNASVPLAQPMACRTRDNPAIFSSSCWTSVP